MKTNGLILSLVLSLLIIVGCKKDDNGNSSGTISPLPTGTIEVVINDIPYPTEKFMRIGYTLKMWEYEKDGLELERIIILDDNTKDTLMKIPKNAMPVIWKNPIPYLEFFTWDEIDHYYISIQLPIPLGQNIPDKISHKLIFKRTLYNDLITVEGGVFQPRKNETPIAIAAPVKGKHWMFFSQSTMGYHFFVLFFMQGDIFTGERYAFDNGRLNAALTGDVTGDSAFNSSYVCYGDTLYAVANGIIVDTQDGVPDRDGNQNNHPITYFEEYPGNYVILEIDPSHYAAYCHCQPNELFVSLGDTVVEGQALALLGNSGNSGMPHLHFQIMDRNDIFFSYGLPYVFKEYKIQNELNPGTYEWINPPQDIITNSLMEMFTCVDFDY